MPVREVFTNENKVLARTKMNHACPVFKSKKQ
jgi:hypothetical protein